MATKSIQQQVKRAKRSRSEKASVDHADSALTRKASASSSTNYTKLLKGWAAMPAVKIVAGGIAGYALVKGAMALYSNRESISEFFKENYESMENKIKDLQSEYTDQEARH